MDVLAKLTTSLVHYAEGLSPQTIQFWLRLVCLLTLPVAASAWTFRRGCRSVFVQVSAGVLGVLAALSLPLDRVRIDSGMARLWLLTLAILIVTFIPVLLPNLLLPTLGAQQRLRKALVLTVGAIILANLSLGVIMGAIDELLRLSSGHGRGAQGQTGAGNNPVPPLTAAGRDAATQAARQALASKQCDESHLIIRQFGQDGGVLQRSEE